MAAEHDSRLAVVAWSPHDPPTRGCCLRSPLWNGLLDEVAVNELRQAQKIVGERLERVSFDVIHGSGLSGVDAAARWLGADLVVVPHRRRLPWRRARRLERTTGARVVEVSA